MGCGSAGSPLISGFLIRSSCPHVKVSLSKTLNLGCSWWLRQCLPCKWVAHKALWLKGLYKQITVNERRRFHAGHRENHMLWTSQSPDVNPVKPLWGILEHYIIHHHHYNTQWGNIFWKNWVSETPRISTKEHWSCSGSSWWDNTFTKTIYGFFCLVCHTSISRNT